MADLPPKTGVVGRRQPVDPDDLVMSFFGTPGVASAMVASGFDVQEEVETLVRHFRDPDPKISLRAHGRLRQVIKDAASASGLLATHEVSGKDPVSGTTYKVSATASRIASKVKELDVQISTTNSGKPDFASRYFPAQREEDNATPNGDEPGVSESGSGDER
jgi:hypothetical protein